MRESFGGAFIIKLALIFIIIYVSFMAVAINYAKAFRVKNGVINILEQYQYSGVANDPALEQVHTYLNSVPYHYGDNVNILNHCQNQGGNLTEDGACIVTKGSEESRYYRVITYISIDFPFFQLHMIIPISGETKLISN